MNLLIFEEQNNNVRDGFRIVKFDNKLLLQLKEINDLLPEMYQ
jgi:hypothetical protein